MPLIDCVTPAKAFMMCYKKHNILLELTEVLHPMVVNRTCKYLLA